MSGYSFRPVYQKPSPLSEPSASTESLHSQVPAQPPPAQVPQTQALAAQAPALTNAVPQAQGGHQWKKWMFLPFIVLLSTLAATAYFPAFPAIGRYFVNTSDLLWHPGHSLLPTAAAVCPDNTLPSYAGCPGPGFLNKDETETYNITVWADRFRYAVLRAKSAKPNLIPGYEAIEPRLMDLQLQGDLLLRQSYNVNVAFQELQGDTLRAINKVFMRAGKTYFFDSSSQWHLLCLTRLCGPPLAQQRALRADILTRFISETVGNMEKFLQDSWWLILGAEIGTFIQAIENVKIATDDRWDHEGYYDSKLCLKTFKSRKCTAYDLSERIVSPIQDYHDAIRKAAADAGQLRNRALAYRSEAEQGVKDMKDGAGKIEEAMQSKTFDTILDSADEFEEFVWWFGRKVRMGISMPPHVEDEDALGSN